MPAVTCAPVAPTTSRSTASTRGVAVCISRAPIVRRGGGTHAAKRWYHNDVSELRDQPLHANSSEAVTNNVRVEVVSQYAPEHSQPFQGEWFFHYTIRITNEGEETVQLLTRHWIITDATGATEEVRGEGVVGEQPVLRAGESFQYTSGCPLKTSTGIMRGTYQMVTEGGDHFEVEIAPFALHEPYTVH
jgi:ApaG protein